jgi:tetratricopeptide (TPR) repeat protein
MSPAKRKVAVSARAGAKPRGQTKARGKARPAARKSRSSAAACDMPLAKLAAAFDRPEGAGPLLSHVPVCGACTTSLTVLAASKQGLKHLTADGTGTAVERVLARGQAQGQKKLADLVYELVKACLVVVQDIDRRLHLDRRPREQAVIGREVRDVAARLPEADRRRLAELPTGSASTERALVAARSCVQILGQLEGRSERQRLSYAVMLICDGQPTEAEACLREFLHDPSRVHRRMAYWNLLWALNRQQKFEQSIDVAQSSLREFPDDWELNFNLAVASAWRRDRARFLSAARSLRLSASAESTRAFREGVLRFEAPRFAQALKVSDREVTRLLGLSNLSGEESA